MVNFVAFLHQIPEVSAYSFGSSTIFWDFSWHFRQSRQELRCCV